jgi:flavin reductase (DIM6/NTAB) family NADH-FMN oxidoreductase RutF
MRGGFLYAGAFANGTFQHPCISCCRGRAERGRILMKEKASFDKSQLLAPAPIVLVGCVHKDLGINLLTVAWCGVDCSMPPMIHVSIRPSRFSHRMVKETGSFTVNVPTREMLKQVDLCGTLSGKDTDKFAKAHLTPLASEIIEAPLVAECPVNLECKVYRVVPLGLHDMFIGEIVARHADSELVKRGHVEFNRLPLIAYVDGEYWSVGERIGTYGFSARERA